MYHFSCRIGVYVYLTIYSIFNNVYGKKRTSLVFNKMAAWKQLQPIYAAYMTLLYSPLLSFVMIFKAKLFLDVIKTQKPTVFKSYIIGKIKEWECALNYINLNLYTLLLTDKLNSCTILTQNYLHRKKN